MLTKKDLEKAGLTPPKSPNDPCPCGSGKKFKKCCNKPHGVTPPTPEEIEAMKAEEAKSEGRANHALALLAPFAMFGMPDVGQMLASDAQHASEKFVKSKVR